MPDWVGRDGASTADRYRTMADVGLRGVSPTYELLSRHVAEDVDVLRLLDELPPGDKQQPNLLFGAVRFLHGPVGSWPAFRAFVLERWADVSATMLARRTQTNEAARCTALLPVLAALPQPLALLEVGASAGLCLFPDRYAYDYRPDDRLSGPPLGSGRPLLTCRYTGPVPVPTALPEVVWRAGLDLNPLDVDAEEDVRWLEALVWPEQQERFTTLREAVAQARADPPPVVAGDLVRDLPGLAAQAPPDATLVVFHTAVLAYVDEAGRAAFADAIGELAASRPTVWLADEAPGVLPDTELDTGGLPRFVLSRDGVPLAFVDPHGASLDWFAAGATP